MTPIAIQYSVSPWQNAIMATAPTKGYDCEFISEVTNEYKCPECKNVLRDPHRVSCCDEEYCKACITPLLRNKNLAHSVEKKKLISPNARKSNGILIN